MIRNSKHVYTNTPTSKGFLGYYVHKVVPKRDSDTVITIDQKYEHAPDLMALDLYGDPSLWWIIPQRNGMQDPIYDFIAGASIIIPSYETVKSIS